MMNFPITVSGIVNLTGSTFFNFIDTYDRVKRNIRSVYPSKFSAEFLLRRIKNYGAFLIEKQLFDFHEAEKAPLTYPLCINLVNFTFV